MTPVQIRQAGESTLAIRWEDEHESLFPARYLRLRCRCAVCVDELTGESKLNPDSVREDVRPIDIKGVGRYGIKIHWNDEHSAGIYTFDFLRETCPCCRGNTEANT